MTELTKQAKIIQEARDALLAHGPLSTAQLVDHCETAEDGRVLSRIVYDLRSAGQIAIDPVPGKPGRDGRPAKRYRWIGPVDGGSAPAAKPKAPTKAQVKPVASVAESIEDEPQNNGAESFRPAFIGTPIAAQAVIDCDCADSTELTLADLVDQADEALLAYADSLLADDPVWKRIRRLADEVHGALCDYRLMRSLEADHA